MHTPEMEEYYRRMHSEALGHAVEWLTRVGFGSKWTALGMCRLCGKPRTFRAVSCECEGKALERDAAAMGVESIKPVEVPYTGSIRINGHMSELAQAVVLGWPHYQMDSVSSGIRTAAMNSGGNAGATWYVCHRRHEQEMIDAKVGASQPVHLHLVDFGRFDRRERTMMEESLVLKSPNGCLSAIFWDSRINLT